MPLMGNQLSWLVVGSYTLKDKYPGKANEFPAWTVDEELHGRHCGPQLYDASLQITHAHPFMWHDRHSRLWGPYKFIPRFS